MRKLSSNERVENQQHAAALHKRATELLDRTKKLRVSIANSRRVLFTTDVAFVLVVISSAESCDVGWLKE